MERLEVGGRLSVGKDFSVFSRSAFGKKEGLILLDYETLANDGDRLMRFLLVARSDAVLRILGEYFKKGTMDLLEKQWLRKGLQVEDGFEQKRLA